MPTSADRSREVEPVSLLIGGRVHAAWTRYSVSSDLLTPASAWHVSLGLPHGEMPPSVRPGAPVIVQVGADTVMTGYVDQVAHEVSKTHTLRMNGRDAASVLVDCSAPIFVGRSMSLADIAQTVVRALGIANVRIDASAGVSEKVAIEPGDTAWDALAKASEANGLWPWFAPDGTLIVGGPDYTASPVASLILRRDGRENNVTSLSVDVSIARRYSDVTVLGQAHGTESAGSAHALQSVMHDADVPLYRPKIVLEGDAPNADACQRKAKKLLADGRLDGLTIAAQVRGHRTSSGALWTPGQRVHVLSEPHGIDGVYFLMARTMTGGRGAPSTTQLTLKEDGVWIPEKTPKKAGGLGSKAKTFSPQELGTRP